MGNINKITTEYRPCVRCKTSHEISNHTKWLCRDCERESKRDRARSLSGDGSIGNLQDLFMQIWGERPHYCTKCGKSLGNEPKAIYFSHIKSRGAHPELAFDKSNIELLCGECHYEWDFGDRKGGRND